MTQEKTSFVYVTYIRSTPEKVFEAITKPEIARRYWGHENVSDWKPGSKWEHVRANDERTVELVGKVIEVSPPTRLVITWANASQAADPASLQPREVRHRGIRGHGPADRHPRRTRSRQRDGQGHQARAGRSSSPA